MKILIMTIVTFFLSTEVLAWRGKVFAVNGRKVTVTSGLKVQPTLGAKMHIIYEDNEVGQGVVSANFHSKTEIVLKSGKAIVGAIVVDDVGVKKLETEAAVGSEHDKALLTAAWDGTESEARDAIAAGANINAVDHNGFSVAMVAARRANAPVLRVLIAAKADLNAVDRRGRTIFALPEPQVFPEIKKILDDAKARAK